MSDCPAGNLSFYSAALLVSLSLAFAAAHAAELKVLSEIEARHQQVHQRVAPAVVAVQTRGARAGAGFYGTGVVISPEGLVLTSSTVVPASTRSVEIYFPDGRVMEARVVGTDETTEACVLQAVFNSSTEAKQPLAYVELADSSKIDTGELAYTAGNPFHTISRDGQVAWSVGTISGLYKITSADEQSRYNGLVIETDAAVNPGSDGGPLLDGEGRLLGILSLCFCESRWLGTAIPVHLIRNGLSSVLHGLSLHDPNATHPSPKNAARVLPDGLRIAARAACRATVKLRIKRESSGEAGEHRSSLVRRLRQRPNAPVSGVIIDGRGYIVTSAFNVEGAIVSIDAQLNDGSIVPAQLLGRHFGLDLAVLKIQPPRNELLPALALTADPDLKIGRFISVLGASEEGRPTATMGIVSAINRLDNTAVQTDALINYGNSGGPVVDLRGRLIGIAAHVQTNADWSQQNSGVGFFTSSDKILACLEDLKAARDMKGPTRPFLGVQPSDLVEIRGVKLEKVVEGSAAAAARLQPGDIIVAVDGMDTHSWAALVAVLKAHKPGDTVEIAFQRGTVTSRTKTILTARKESR